MLEFVIVNLNREHKFLFCSISSKENLSQNIFQKGYILAQKLLEIWICI